jgi:hypothetical protein
LTKQYFQDVELTDLQTVLQSGTGGPGVVGDVHLPGLRQVKAASGDGGLRGNGPLVMDSRSRKPAVGLAFAEMRVQCGPLERKKLLASNTKELAVIGSKELAYRMALLHELIHPLLWRARRGVGGAWSLPAPVVSTPERNRSLASIRSRLRHPTMFEKRMQFVWWLWEKGKNGFQE